MNNILNLNTNQLPTDERPYEKCKKYGAEALDDSELLAVILRCGVPGMNSVQLSQAIINMAGDNGIVGINSLTYDDLTKIKGIGCVKALQILCISELSKRISKGMARPTLEFSSASSVAGYYMEDLRHYDTERVLLVMLDTKNHYLGEKIISIGTVNSSYLSPREVFIEALNKRAVKIILLHNHPSGDPTPSKDDIIATEKIKESGKIIGIELLDHIIIGDNRYISLKSYNVL